MSIDDLLDAQFPGAAIDYLYISIQGGEPAALAGDPRWPARVRAIKVELQAHLGFDADAAAARLRELGYQARPDPLWLGGCMIGLPAAVSP